MHVQGPLSISYLCSLDFWPSSLSEIPCFLFLSSWLEKCQQCNLLFMLLEKLHLWLCCYIKPCFCMCSAAPASLFLSRHLFLLICLHMDFFSFSAWDCFVLFSPHSCMSPTCCLFAVWCPGWSWMASISTCLKQRTSRPTTSVQRGQVCSVTLKPSSLATRRTCVALFLSTPTLSVEGGKLGEWRSPRVLPLMCERFCVTPAHSRGASFAMQCPCAWLWSAAAASSLVILVLAWGIFSCSIERAESHTIDLKKCPLLL